MTLLNYDGNKSTLPNFQSIGSLMYVLKSDNFASSIYMFGETKNYLNVLYFAVYIVNWIYHWVLI